MSKKNLKKFVKYDVDKTRYDLLYGPFIEGVSDILTFGAKKYDDDNWHKCTSIRTYFSACCRHLFAFFYTKEDNDPETKKNHLLHAGCCVMFMFGIYQIHGSKADDRPNNNVAK